MKLKVCGMRETENILDLSILKPDYMGFIFWEKSSRFVKKSTPDLNKKIKKTGVFVDASEDYICNMISLHHLQAVQLHGRETPRFCEQIKNLGVEVIKTFSIKKHFDFSILMPYEENCDFFLFDTNGKLPGGNGYAFEWNILKHYPSKKSFFLSGGIGIDNMVQIKKILKRTLPIYAVDVNSKFEIAPGIKKIKALKEFKKEIDEL